MTHDVSSKLATALQDLRSQREAVVIYNTALEGYKREALDGPTPASIRERQANCSKEIKKSKSGEESARKAALENTKKERKLMSELDGCKKSKRRMTKEKKKTIDSSKELRNEWNKQDRAFQKWKAYENRLWYQQQKEQRNAEFAAQELERREKQVGIVTEEDGSKIIPNPKAKEIAVLTSLIVYVTALMPKQHNRVESRESQNHSSSTVAERNAQFSGKEFQQFQVPEQNSKDENPYSLGALNLKNKRGGPKANKVKKEKDLSTRKVDHIPDVFSKFHSVRVAIPLQMGQLPETLEALQSKKAEYEKWVPPTKEEAAAVAAKVVQEAAAAEAAAAEKAAEKLEQKKIEENQTPPKKMGQKKR